MAAKVHIFEKVNFNSLVWPINYDSEGVLDFSMFYKTIYG